MNTEAFRRAMRVLPEPPRGPGPPQWEYWRHDLWTRVTRGDDPTGFFGWPCIYHTMLVGHWYGHDDVEWGAIESDLSRWRPAIELPSFGYPLDYHGGTPYGATLIHQAYHLKQWEDHANERVEDLDTIVEFGGGYGAMALLVNKLGFRGRYVIHDLPEFALLQQFYLSNVGVKDVEWPTSLCESNTDLLIACHSLSESPKIVRGEFLSMVSSRNYLLLYSKTRVDFEASHFQELIQQIDGIHWDHRLVEGLPPGNWYSVGRTV